MKKKDIPVQIVVNSKSNCVQCNATYRALNAVFAKAGAEPSYTVVDMEAHPEVLEEMKALGHAQAPVVLVKDGEQIVDSWSGFNPAKTKQYAQQVAAAGQLAAA